MELAKQSGKTSLPGRTSLQDYLRDLLAEADIQVGGDRPWDMQVNNPGVAERIFTEGSLGLGEGYMDGDWEAQALDEFIHRVLRARLHRQVRPARVLLHYLKSRLLNRQTVSRAKEVGERHYDLGNDFYRAMLDSRMTYTCGYWKDADTLEQAQQAKLDLICRKLQLEPGMRVLDIGCGWGSFMSWAAEHYGVECVGVTISREQADLARQMYPDLPLEFRLQDYRDVDETFDRIVSIGMFEHVGNKNYRTYMEVAHRCLKEGGLFLLHTIGKNERAPQSDPWMDRYIFPNGELPSVGQIGDAVDNLFVVEDLHNFGSDYDRTLMAWYRNFEKAWPRFAEDLGERFFRMWRFYLLSCAGAFRARDLQLWQWVLSKGNPEGVYARVT
ncbi:cyclopropane fatty acyl phospholipid synthase [Marinobacter segnicrescens]|uniref:Cyclopropane-fatty-acyl-phospholipid synthase n=1 Tax=Marinobacter segnicrescens TaxID=430453 RepID=A0A1I0C7L5_9GAMM|nr:MULTISPECIES: cyclopropane fatty acyl phospholipid synthase [Marinobacter]UZD64854.1 cyclopropane fatty acyl phospholipid synthase [Marinobacter sp. AN1]SET15537.1 cyclopropane-fatty-acyl-phospholipid synthase [Marinobacter segnicrescens]